MNSFCEGLNAHEELLDFKSTSLMFGSPDGLTQGRH